jgi:hypothetical protein
VHPDFEKLQRLAIRDDAIDRAIPTTQPDRTLAASQTRQGLVVKFRYPSHLIDTAFFHLAAPVSQLPLHVRPQLREPGAARTG